MSSVPCDRSAGAPARVRGVQLGAISFPQRFGRSLPSKTLSIEDAKHPHYHYHYHVRALAGVISSAVEHGVRFHEATALEAPDAEALARTVQLRVLRWVAGCPARSPEVAQVYACRG